jgi:S1-C subfamily serine protease
LDEYGNVGTGGCTAFSINDLRDYFLTAAHCFGTNMTVGDKPARLVLLDIPSDLMVLVVPESGEVPEVRPAKLRDCPDGSRGYTCQGQDLAAMGYGFGGMVPLLKTGTVAYSNVAIPGWGFGANEEMLLTGFSYIPGMSGGPVFNRDGRIVGVVQWGDNDNYVGGGRALGEVLRVTGEYWGVNEKR